MSAQSPRILIIDDEPQIHRFLRPALEANGFEMLSAMTGAEGLAALTRRTRWCWIWAFPTRTVRRC